MNLIARIIYKIQRLLLNQKRKRRPADWNLTGSDLFAEMESGKRNSIGPPETEWAEDYERELLEKWAKFPKDGEIYKANFDTNVSYIVHWRAPSTDGGDCIIEKGTKLQVQVFKDNPKPLGVYATPLEYERLEREIVPESYRNAHKYGGYSLSITTEELNKNFTLESSK